MNILAIAGVAGEGSLGGGGVLAARGGGGVEGRGCWGRKGGARTQHDPRHTRHVAPATPLLLEPCCCCCCIQGWHGHTPWHNQQCLPMGCACVGACSTTCSCCCCWWSHTRPYVPPTYHTE